MRHGVHADDGILQVDEDECGLFGVELEFSHGYLFVENISKSRISSIFLDLEYEGVLDFVKSRSRRTAAGTLDAPAGRFSGRSCGTHCRSRLRSSDYDGGRGAKRVFHRRALQLLSG